MRGARLVSMSSRRRAMSSLCTSSTDVTFYRTSKSSGVEACCGPEKWTGRWVTRRSSEIKVHPACWATAPHTPHRPPASRAAASGRAWSSRAISSATTVTFGSQPKVVAKGSARSGSFQVRLMAPATSVNTKFGTMMGGARVRSPSRTCRPVAWPASIWENPLTHRLASTVYMVSPVHRQDRCGERLSLWRIHSRQHLPELEEGLPDV